MANNPVKVNPLGQISDGVVEQVKEAGADTVRAVATEPAKILEQILGGSRNDSAQSGEQNLEQGNPLTSSGQFQLQNDLKLKQQESQEESAAKYKLHQQRLQEEIGYHSQKKQEEEIEEKQKEQQQEEQKKQIVQLKKETEDEAVWQKQLKAVQGSHESQQGKM